MKNVTSIILSKTQREQLIISHLKEISVMCRNVLMIPTAMVGIILTAYEKEN